MLAYIDSRKEKAQTLMESILNSSVNDIEKASLRDKMGALKILNEVLAGQKGKEGNETEGGVKFEFVFKDTSIKDETDNHT